jgi:hypothetical protein
MSCQRRVLASSPVNCKRNAGETCTRISYPADLCSISLPAGLDKEGADMRSALRARPLVFCALQSVTKPRRCSLIYLAFASAAWRQRTHPPSRSRSSQVLQTMARQPCETDRIHRQCPSSRSTLLSQSSVESEFHRAELLLGQRIRAGISEGVHGTILR